MLELESGFHSARGKAFVRRRLGAEAGGVEERWGVEGVAGVDGDRPRPAPPENTPLRYVASPLAWPPHVSGWCEVGEVKGGRARGST